MTQQIVNIGSSENKGDGDPLRTAFQKINENFTELYTPVPTTSTITDIKGSVFADDSMVLVDAVNGKVTISNQNLDALADVSYDPADTGPPAVDFQPLVWDTVAGKWMPGYSVTSNFVTANNRVEIKSSAFLQLSDTVFNTQIQTVPLTANRNIYFPDAGGTVALTSDLFDGAYSSLTGVPIKNTTDTNQDYLADGDTITVDYLSFQVAQNGTYPWTTNLNFAYNDPNNNPMIQVYRTDNMQGNLYNVNNHGQANAAYSTLLILQPYEFASFIVSDYTNGRLYQVSCSFYQNPQVTNPGDSVAIMIYIETLKD